jgi:hypothetical protein
MATAITKAHNLLIKTLTARIVSSIAPGSGIPAPKKRARIEYRHFETIILTIGLPNMVSLWQEGSAGLTRPADIESPGLCVVRELI